MEKSEQEKKPIVHMAFNFKSSICGVKLPKSCIIFKDEQTVSPVITPKMITCRRCKVAHKFSLITSRRVDSYEHIPTP